jgi:hypothetical protein
LHIKIDDDHFDSDLLQRCHTTKLQIVILCPLFIGLEFSMVKSRLLQILKTDRTIGMLIDVKETQMLDIHRECMTIILNWNLWNKLNYFLQYYHRTISGRNVWSTTMISLS